ncbi:cytochrome c-type biogenesis protein CcsB [Allocatelliglobosispora scoriae]|uniref:Cytochrome c-type biogenesis protein CcsB n=1 Tax=Allocatelliglobosispora scoriae TaxID=643052 RepID=A0A841BUF3_9ACTN|nr:c-type cytochrome biogenesis protein CcsB [Allocatelliglobosispora scoriae]MBB5870789.1 cytochrome c-type biogenesis protein CcsB [Allocatelliglobosispora scoriae]
MSALSDTLFIVALLGYLVAMMLYATAYVIKGASRQAAAPAEELALVGAGSAAPPVSPVEVVAPPAASDEPQARWMTAAVVSMWLAVAVHLATAATRGIAAGRMPWGNMYEFILSVTVVGGMVWLAVVTAKPSLRQVGLFVALVEALLLGVAGLVYAEVGPLMPALQSTWYIVHVSSVIIASGLFMVGFVPSALFLIRSGYDQGKTSFPYTLGRRVPIAANLERLSFRLHAFAFPIWTFGVAAGAVWAEAAWGRYWGWDPKEVWAFISWVVYAGFLHARATPSVKRTTVAWIAVLGFATMLMNLFGVNIFFTGLHSYAGVE